MGLRLSYVDRSRLWADLVNTGGDRVFVSTDEPYVAGAHVAIIVTAPEFPSPLQLSAVIQSLRPASGAVPGGVVVKIDPGSVERCRAALGAVTEAPVHGSCHAWCATPARRRRAGASPRRPGG